MTVGDFWGDVDYPEEHEKGVSIVIAHSALGDNVLRKSNITCHKTTWQKFLKRNYRMVYGRDILAQYHPIHHWSSWCYEKCSYDTLKKYSNYPFGQNRVGIFIYKVFRHFLLHRSINKRIKKEINQNDIL